MPYRWRNGTCHLRCERNASWRQPTAEMTLPEATFSSECLGTKINNRRRSGETTPSVAETQTRRTTWRSLMSRKCIC